MERNNLERKMLVALSHYKNIHMYSIIDIELLFIPLSYKSIAKYFKRYVETFQAPPTKDHALDSAEQDGNLDSDTLLIVYDEIASIFSTEYDPYFGQVLKNNAKSLLFRTFISTSPILDPGESDYKRLGNIYTSLKRIESDFVPPIDIDTMPEINTSKSFHLSRFRAFSEIIRSGIGFRSPSHYTISSDGKGFKTGWLLNIAVALAELGANVYLADFENGQAEILESLRQLVCRCKLEDIYSETNLTIYDRWVKKCPGSIRYKRYVAQTHSVSDVEADILSLDFKIDCILFDYLPLAAPSKSNDHIGANVERLHIDAAALNGRLGTFSITPVQKTADNQGKRVVGNAGFRGGVLNVFTTTGQFDLYFDPELSLPSQYPEEEGWKAARVYPITQRGGIGSDDWQPSMDIIYAINKSTRTMIELDEATALIVKTTKKTKYIPEDDY